MFSHRLNSRLDMTPMQSNILMTQIRAQKNNCLHQKRTPLVITSHREHQGKKIFKEILYRPSLSPSQKENSPNNCFRANGGRREFNGQQINRSRSGKKKVLNINTNDELKKNLQGDTRWGKRRFDYSPSHQHHKTNINFCWN